MNNNENKEDIQKNTEQEQIEEVKTKKSRTILIILLIIIIFGLVFYLLFSNGIINLENKKNNAEVTSNEKQDDNKEKEKITAVDLFDSNGYMVDGKYKLGNKEVTLKMETDDEGLEEVIKLDGKEIFKSGFGSKDNRSIGSMYTMGDIIIIVTSGTDIRTDYIHILDEEGKEIKTIKNEDDNNPKMKLLEHEIANNHIGYTRSMLGHGFTIDNSIELIDYETCESLLEKNNISKDLVVITKYEIEYLGNKKFSNEKVISETRISEEMAKNIEKCKNNR